jgi:RNA 2',3'-cyclic 3'-phosphodiesterase
MRLFIALDIDEGIRARIARFLDGVRGFAPEARWVRPESLHVTLKFIGEKSQEEAESIERTLETIRADGFDLNLGGLGFFPSPRAPQIFWIGVGAEPKLAALAMKIDETTATLHITREEHAFNPHLTLARGEARSRRERGRKEASQPSGLQHLQTKLAAMPAPEFGRMTAREFFLYRSQPGPGGSKYTKLARYALR